MKLKHNKKNNYLHILLLLTFFTIMILRTIGDNLLIELYIVIDIKSYIMAPNSYKEFNNSYEIIAASKVVMGKIPLYFGDTMEQSSAIVSS